MNDLQRNVFDLSHDKKLTCDMGKLVPIYLEEVLPGDHIKLRTSLVTRINPLLAPIMHKVDIFTHYYFVPNRLVWADWEKFITGGEDGLDATAAPYISLAGPTAEGSLADYLGIPIYYAGAPLIPTAYVNPITVDARPFRAYNLIYNEWYRNTNHQTKVANVFTNGADATSNTTLLSRNWELDYFTAARPWAQRGTAVTLPLGSTADVLRRSNAQNAKLYLTGTDTAAAGNEALLTDGTGQLRQTTNATLLSIDPKPGAGASGLYADLTNATAATINVIRQAFQVQRWMEKNARTQARYVNLLQEHFGVRLDDYRAARPVFLGGGRSPVVISEVLQNSETTVNSPQGNMSGHGFSVQNEHAFSQSFQEHGLVIGIMSVMPRTSYQQGLHRMWSRTSKYSYYWPTFAHLGDQEVLKKEVYCDGDTGDADIFGYVGRYDEYRFHESSVHGEFKNGLNYWHMGRIFDSRPTLNSTFITADPTDRIIAVQDAPPCLVSVHHDVKALRVLPAVSMPGFVDH